MTRGFHTHALSALFSLSVIVMPSLLAQAPAAGQAKPQFKGIFEPINYPEDITLYDTFFVTGDVGSIAGGTVNLVGGVILHTRDGGTTWTVQHGDPQSSDAAVKSLRFLDEKTGWAISKDRILHTRDGESWILSGTLNDNYVDYMFTSANRGVYLGPNGDVHRTDNGGRSWQPAGQCAGRVEVEGLTRSVQCNWVRLQFVTPTVGYAVGVSYDAPDVVFLAKTVDGGAAWTMTTGRVTGKAEDAVFLDENTGYVRVGYWDNGQLFKTDDGGKTWTGVAGSPGQGMAFADPEVGWAFGLNKLSFTTDGGKRWNSRTFAFPGEVTAFSLPRRDRGYVVGVHGMIYRYRIVPIAANVPKSIAAPLMPGFDSPLDDQVEKLVGQLTALEKSAATSGAAADALPPSFAGQLTAVEATLSEASTEAPRFTAKYRNLNLLGVGHQMTTDLPAQMQGMRDSVQGLKQGSSAKSTATAIPAVRAKAQGLDTMVDGFFQKGQ